MSMMCVCVLTGVYMCATAQVWRSEDHFQKSLLLPLWVPGIKLLSSGLCGKYFYSLLHLVGPEVLK